MITLFSSQRGFKATAYFDTLLARYHGTRKTRPVAKPRYGSVIERLFDTTNKEFIFNLLGNTQAAKQRRQLTKAVDPKELAVWTLGDLYTYLMLTLTALFHPPQVGIAW